MKETVKATQLCPTLCDSMDYTVCGILRARILEWVAIPSPGDSPIQFSNPGRLHWRLILYHLSHNNIAVSSLSLLQWIFLTQESNQGLLHCKQMLYQLSGRRYPLYTGLAVVGFVLPSSRSVVMAQELWSMASIVAEYMLWNSRSVWQDMCCRVKIHYLWNSGSLDQARLWWDMCSESQDSSYLEYIHRIHTYIGCMQ